jgi:hypothetical protein
LFLAVVFVLIDGLAYGGGFAVGGLLGFALAPRFRPAPGEGERPAIDQATLRRRWPALALGAAVLVAGTAAAMGAWRAFGPQLTAWTASLRLRAYEALVRAAGDEYDPFSLDGLDLPTPVRLADGTECYYDAEVEWTSCSGQVMAAGPAHTLSFDLRPLGPTPHYQAEVYLSAFAELRASIVDRDGQVTVLRASPELSTGASGYVGVVPAQFSIAVEMDAVEPVELYYTLTLVPASE